MTGVIDVGGGMRAIFQCGVFDYFLDEDMHFDLAIGVSAGSANLASYLSHQRGRNHTFFTVYNQRWQYMSFRNLLLTGNYLNLEYIYGTLANHDGEYPFDYATFAKDPTPFYSVTTNALTGKPLYLGRDYIAQDHLEACKASSCVPFACRPWPIDGVPCYDGGLSDPVPIRKALDDGCDKIVILLAHPKSERKNQEADIKHAKRIRKKYPAIADAFLSRADKYNEGLALGLELEKEGKAIILAPDTIEGTTMLERDKGKLEALYQEGYKKGPLVKEFLESA